MAKQRGEYDLAEYLLLCDYVPANFIQIKFYVVFKKKKKKFYVMPSMFTLEIEIG